MDFTGPNNQNSPPSSSSPSSEHRVHPQSLVPGVEPGRQTHHPNAFLAGDSVQHTNNSNAFPAGDSVQQQANNSNASSPSGDSAQHMSNSYAFPAGDAGHHTHHPNAFPVGGSAQHLNNSNGFPTGDSIQHSNASAAGESAQHMNSPSAFGAAGGSGHHMNNSNAFPGGDFSQIVNTNPNAFPPGDAVRHMNNFNAYPAGWPKPAYRQPLVDVDNLPELVTQPPSYFHHDDKTEQDEESPERQDPTGRQTSSSARERLSQILPASRRNRHIVYILIPVLLLVIAGGVLGGLFGSGTLHPHSQSGNPDESSQDHTLDGEANVQIRDTSQLAAALVGTSVSSFTLVLFQNADGELAAIEWQGSKGDVYLLKNRFGEAKPPKPMEHSPFQAVTYGPSGDLHVFYFDDAMRVTHIVRRAKNKEPMSWERGSLVLRSRPDLVPASSLRLSVTSLSSKWVGLKDDTLVLVYHTGASNDSVALVSSTQPDDPESWDVQAFSLGAKDLGLQLHPDSPGLLVLPIARHDAVGIRMVWDLDNSSHKTTFGIMDCTFTKSRELEDCVALSNDWKDSAAEEEVLQMPKPLRLASLPIEIKEDGSAPADRYIVRVLDAQGRLTELLWDTHAWTGHLGLTNETTRLPDIVPSLNFTSIASANDGLLYAMSEGKLLEFYRENAWWTQPDNEIKDVPAWKLLDQVDTKLSKN